MTLQGERMIFNFIYAHIYAGMLPQILPAAAQVAKIIPRYYICRQFYCQLRARCWTKVFWAHGCKS
jgi:hypothetical protein